MVQAAAAAASSIPAVTTGADIDTDELVDETGVEPKDIELIMSQVCVSCTRGMSPVRLARTVDIDVRWVVEQGSFAGEECSYLMKRGVISYFMACSDVRRHP